MTKAWELFNKMCDRYDNGDITCKPSLAAFNSVLNVCAFNRNKETHDVSVRIALLTQERLLENTAIYGQPDTGFFNRLIKVFGYCISDPKVSHRFISTAFERCAKEGLVDESVLKLLNKLAPQVYQKLHAESKVGVSIHALPKDWSRNVAPHSQSIDKKIE